ncbi:MAG: bleomycin resistance protein [Pseudomonadota bacterium]
MSANRITANLPSRDFAVTEDFYGSLGFATAFKGDNWMILIRDSLEVEFFPHPELDPKSSWFSACMRLDDIDKMYQEWVDLGIPTEGTTLPRLGAPVKFDGAPRMFFLHDPDGSLWRILDNGDTD